MMQKRIYRILHMNNQSSIEVISMDKQKEEEKCNRREEKVLILCEKTWYFTLNADTSQERMHKGESNKKEGLME